MQSKKELNIYTWFSLIATPFLFISTIKMDYYEIISDITFIIIMLASPILASIAIAKDYNRKDISVKEFIRLSYVSLMGGLLVPALTAVLAAYMSYS